MSLLKVPFIFLTAFGYHLCLTPPNGVPPQHEKYVAKAGPARLCEDGLGLVIALLPTLRVLQWGLGLLECIAIFSSAYPTMTLAQVASPYLSYNDIRLSDLTITQPTASFFTSCLLAYAGYSFRYNTFRYLGNMFTFELTQRSDRRLVTGGPYAIVRHPSYTGEIVGFVGHIGCTLDANSWVRQSGVLYTFGGSAAVGFWIFALVAIPSLLVWRIRSEDEMLHHAFGKEWEKWAARVRYRIIPGIY